MNKNNFIVPNIIITIIISVIYFLSSIKNLGSSIFYIVYALFLGFNILGCIIIGRKIRNKIKEDINIAQFIIVYSVFYFFSTVILFLNRNGIFSLNTILMIYTGIYGFYSIITYLLSNSMKYLENNQNKNDMKTSKCKNWQMQIEILINNEKNNKCINDLKLLFEDIKYSDYSSNEATKNIDTEIDNIIENLKQNLTTENIETLRTKINERRIILKNNK